MKAVRALSVHIHVSNIYIYIHTYVNTSILVILTQANPEEEKGDGSLTSLYTETLAPLLTDVDTTTYSSVHSGTCGPLRKGRIVVVEQRENRE